MARIQKKKSTFKPKSKKDDAAGLQIASGQPEAVEAKSHAPEASSDTPDVDKEKKKKKVMETFHTATTEQTAIIKLANKYFGSWIQFFREVRVELGKVAWPSRKQTIGSTVVVIIFVFMIALFLGIVDFGLSNIVRLIL